MSYIDDLIKECCPDRVEWKELGERAFCCCGWGAISRYLWRAWKSIRP